MNTGSPPPAGADPRPDRADRTDEISTNCDVGAHTWCNDASCVCACHRPRELALWVVYDRPADYPTSAIARRWIVDAAGLSYTRSASTTSVITAPTLDELRDRLAVELVGAVIIPRSDDDDPGIVETWI